MNIYESLASSARTWPEEIAVADKYGQITFSELLSAAEKLKAALLQQGLRKGNGVGVLIQNNRHFLIALYASLACDAVVMPISYQQTKNEIGKAIREADLHFVVSENHSVLDDLCVRCVSFAGESLTLHQTNRSANEGTANFVPNAALMRFTSGTTGEAKCVVLSHRSVWERTEAANQGLNLSSSDKILWVLPMAYHFIVSIMLYVRYGAGVIVCDDFLADAVIEKANAHSATVLYAAPLHIRLLTLARHGARFKTLRKVISTTTGISKKVCDAFYGLYHLPVVQAFGIIEVGLPIMNARASVDHPDAVGVPLPAFRIAILDEAFRPTAPGRSGRLAIEGPGMFDGYLKPQLPASAVLKNGMFLTGDLALQTEGGLIVILGRTNTMIHVSGNKVFPDEVEDILLQYPGVLQAQVFAQEHPYLGQIVAANLVMGEKDVFNVDDILRYCRPYLSSYKIPQKIYRVNDIAITGSGKVKRFYKG